MKSLSFKIFIALIVISSALVIVILNPYFNITQITVKNNENVSESQIISAIGLENSTSNLFAFNVISAKKTLLENPYIEEVSFARHFPNSLEISVTERKIRGYVPYMNSYLYIDSEGRVLDIKKSYTQKLPLVIGLEFDSFVLGEVLQTENSGAFTAVVELSKLINKYNLLENTVKLDVSSLDDIHLYINSVDVLFGDFKDYNQKLEILNEIIKKIPKDDKGFLDIRDVDKNPVFTYMTWEILN